MRNTHSAIWLTVCTAIGMILPFQARAEEVQPQSAKMLFSQYCRDCHGLQRDGRGGLRPFLEQDPANLTSQATQDKTDRELFAIIKNGGGIELHGWADTLSDPQILELVRYLRTLSP